MPADSCYKWEEANMRIKFLKGVNTILQHVPGSACLGLDIKVQWLSAIRRMALGCLLESLEYIPLLLLGIRISVTSYSCQGTFH